VSLHADLPTIGSYVREDCNPATPSRTGSLCILLVRRS
jgi:hypothetical protein